MAPNKFFKFPVQMASVPMESKLSFDVRFIFLTLGILPPFRQFIKFQLAINRIPLSPLVFHMRYKFVYQTYEDMYAIVQWLQCSIWTQAVVVRAPTWHLFLLFCCFLFDYFVVVIFVVGFFGILFFLSLSAYQIKIIEVST